MSFGIAYFKHLFWKGPKQIWWSKRSWSSEGGAKSIIIFNYNVNEMKLEVRGDGIIEI